LVRGTKDGGWKSGRRGKKRTAGKKNFKDMKGTCTIDFEGKGWKGTGEN